MRLESINIGRAEVFFVGSEATRSGIRKRPVEGSVQVRREGLVNDAIVAVRHHGGPDQAVYAYSADDYDWWAQSSSFKCYPGLFGENLTIRDLPSDMRVGDRLLIGEVVLEATAPRIPCETFAARIGEPGFGLRFRDAERPGIYFRVLNEGEITAGDSVTLVEGDDHDVTILDLFRFKYRRKHDPAELQRLLGAPIAERMRADIEVKLASLQ